MTAATPPPTVDSSQRSRIQILPPHLVNQIAAGEVVERPASVVKELIENSIDAGAREIEVELENGGRTLIEIRDDGCGLSHAEAELALQRHATSKIREFDDLQSIRTLGFRGEALPSIASVSRFTLTSFDNVEECAIEIESDAGTLHKRLTSRAPGTTIRVVELFENVPARRKFLRSSDAEFRAIVHVVTSYALPLFDRSFSVSHNGRVVLDLPATTSARDRIIQVIGHEAAKHLEPIDFSIGEVRASGFVTRGLRYGSKRNQFFFVNQRLVRDKVLTHAASRAGEAFDFDGHPAVVLFLDLPPAFVDVNVHPAKTEVRFRDSGTVHVVVERAIRDALAGPAEGVKLLNIAEASTPADSADPAPHRDSFERHTGMRQSTMPPLSLPPQLPRVPADAMPLFHASSAVVQPPAPQRSVDLGALRGRVIGQYRDSYILVDMPEGLRLIDQHAAHERVLYEKINRGFEAFVSSQQLLTPFVFDAAAAETALLETHLEDLRNCGFEIERFSRQSFGVSSVPALLQNHNLHSFFRKLIDESSEERHSPLVRIRDRVVASVACQAAIKVHRSMSGDEMSRVVSDLLECENPFACPHGRPVIVDIRHLDIEKHFHRK